MANKIKLKQSSVSGKVPTTTDLDLGELGINTYDGKLFLKQKVGAVETIIDVTGAASGVTSVSGSAPIVSSGGVTPSISISAATTTNAGSMSAADKTKIDAVTGTNTGDETASTIKTKLGITTLSGSNTGDQVIPVASSTTPAALGTAAVGTGTTFARADHVHTLPSLATLGAQAAGSYITSGSGNSEFVAGTALLFYQAAAPTGWTKSTTNNDKALRVVSGTTGGTAGGSVAFSAAFASKTPAGSVSTSITGITATIGSFTLTANEIPNHQHGYRIQYKLGSAVGLTGEGICGANPATGYSSYNASPQSATDTGGVGNAGHNHTFTFGSGTASSAFTGTAINLAVQYVDVIICTKD